MPFVSNMPEDEQKTDPSLTPQGAVAPVGGGSAVRLSPSAAVAPTGSSTTGSSATGAAPLAGGQFGSLQNYLAANQGQAEPLAGKLTTGINQQYQNLAGQNASVLGGIGGQVAAGSSVPSNASQILSAEAANPVSFASNQSNIPSFQSLLNASYSGPASAESAPEFSAQQNAINKAISTGQNATQTEAGRENLLTQNEAAPTTGVTALNSAILSQSPEALGSVENAYKPFSNLLTGLSSGAADINKQIADAQANAVATSAQAQQQVVGQSNTLNQQVQDELAAAQAKAAQQETQTKAALANLYGGVAPDTTASILGTYGGGTTPWYNMTNYKVGTIDPATVAALGMSPGQATALQQAMQQAGTSQMMLGHNFGAGSPTSQIDLSQFLTQANPNQVLTAANVATPEQYAQTQAFQKLLGVLPAGAILNPAQAGMAGTAPTNLSSLDYQNALNLAQQTAAQERQAGQEEANALTGAADLAHAQSQHKGIGGFFKTLLPTLTRAAINPLLTVPKQIAAGKNASTKLIAGKK